ncbi:MAG: hypothetical protein HY049_09025 [Acidobacteria bacterium]|nr:hypothetical protein [Acidobacteriota bacterium]
MSEQARLEEIRAYVVRFIEAARIDVVPVVRSGDEGILIDLNGPDDGLLVERKGELLESVQFLLAKVVQKQFGPELRVLVDCANYRLGREKEITEMARRTAERVKRIGESAELSPMNPYERRIVHLALSEDPGVQTESSGDGFMKRVRIYPASASK